MNERIKQLAKQAGFFPELNWDHTGWHAAGHDNTFEKFAELIVEEMYVFMCNATDNDKPWPTFKEVKTHFGVE